MTAPAPDAATARRPTLKRELLASFALVAGAAISLAVVTALLAQLLQPRHALAGLIALIVADVAVLFLFTRYLLERHVLKPLADLGRAAEALAAGNLAARARSAETAELAQLAARFNHMTDRLLDAQAQLVRAEKLAGIGRLAAGVAHEIGNPLSAIGTYVEVLERRGVDPEVLRNIAREAGRIDRIVRGLLEYARPHDEAPGEVDLGAVVRSMVELLRHQGTLKGATVTVELEPGLPPVRGRVHALEQVVVNLLLNALDAADGRITVGAAPRPYRVSMSDEHRRGEPTADAVGRRGSGARRPWRPELLEGAPGVVLWVADSGPGIPAEDRDRVFDPFFTTKAPGHGTGLGLAIVQRTVDELGGLVWVDDAREGGAAFKVFLPAAA